MKQNIEDEIRSLLESVLKNLGVAGVDFNIEILPAPHEIITLPANRMAIYMFEYKGEFLKIGKAGPKSKARFSSQHYNPKRASSTLAGSMLRDSRGTPWQSCTEATIEKWIKTNTRRINIYLEDKHGRAVLNLFEAVLQCRYKPRYEGS